MTAALDEIEPAALGQLYEQVEIGLSMLKHAGKQRAGDLSHNRQAEIRDKLTGQVGEAHLEVRPHGLALAQSV